MPQDVVRDGRDLMQNDGLAKPDMPPPPMSPEDQRIFNEMLTLFASNMRAPEHPNYRHAYAERTGEATV